MAKTSNTIKIDCSYDKLIPVKDLRPNPANPNTHTEEQVKLTAAIIKSTKWRYPITVSNQSGMIVDGHCRQEAGLLIGDIKVPVDYQDFDSLEDEKAEMIRKNKLEELSELDGLKMADIFVDLDQVNYDLSLTALTQEEIEDIVVGPTFQPSSEEQSRLDELTPLMVKCPECDCEFNAREHEKSKVISCSV